jgi:hypothetical protein
MKSKLIVLALGLGIGYWLGYARYSPKQVIETNAPEIRQSDGSLVLERNISETKIPKKPPIMPFTGSEWLRHTEVTIKPNASLLASNGEIKPIVVKLDLIRLSDKTYRVIANAEGGEVIGGIDVPIETTHYPDPPKWAAGGIILNNGYGAFIQRSVGAFLIGLDVTQTTHKAVNSKDLGYSLRIGVRF